VDPQRVLLLVFVATLARGGMPPPPPEGMPRADLRMAVDAIGDLPKMCVPIPLA